MPEFISYDRAADKISTVAQPRGGTWGQASFGRLCELVEQSNEIRKGERITAFVIEDGMIKFQIERQ